MTFPNGNNTNPNHIKHTLTFSYMHRSPPHKYPFPVITSNSKPPTLSLSTGTYSLSSLFLPLSLSLQCPADTYRRRSSPPSTVVAVVVLVHCLRLITCSNLNSLPIHRLRLRRRPRPPRLLRRLLSLSLLLRPLFWSPPLFTSSSACCLVAATARFGRTTRRTT